MNFKKGIDETYNMKTNDQLTIFTRPFIMALLATICCFLWGSAFPAIKLGYRWFDIMTEATSTQILFAGYLYIGRNINCRYRKYLGE